MVPQDFGSGSHIQSLPIMPLKTREGEISADGWVWACGPKSSCLARIVLESQTKIQPSGCPSWIGLTKCFSGSMNSYMVVGEARMQQGFFNFRHVAGETFCPGIHRARLHVGLIQF
jgi:hypothetical protein